MWQVNVLFMCLVATSSTCQQTCEFGDSWWGLNEEKSYLQCDINKSKTLNHKSIEQQVLINREKQKSRITILVCNFLAILLLISALIAVFEVCRDRYFKQDQPKTLFSSATPELRRCSLVDLTVSRHARRSADHPARLTKDHRSLSVQNRPLLGARPPPLIRRSSFPVQVPRDSGSPGAGTPAQESCEGTPHRIRLIRRH